MSDDICKCCKGTGWVAIEGRRYPMVPSARRCTKCNKEEGTGMDYEKMWKDVRRQLEFDGAQHLGHIPKEHRHDILCYMILMEDTNTPSKCLCCGKMVPGHYAAQERCNHCEESNCQRCGAGDEK